MNRCAGKANFEAGFVGVLRCCPFMLVKADVSVGIVNIVRSIRKENQVNQQEKWSYCAMKSVSTTKVRKSKA